jgi:hypothetical protein
MIRRRRSQKVVRDLAVKGPITVFLADQQAVNCFGYESLVLRRQLGRLFRDFMKKRCLARAP